MSDETMKYFLEQMIESIEGITDALTFILQYYHVVTAEKEYLQNKKATQKED